MARLESGVTIIITAGTPIFSVDDVGRQIWKKYNSDGTGGGKAEILQYLNASQVLCKVRAPFDSDELIDFGNWYLTTDTITGLDYLEGETVSVIADGGTHRDVTVIDGTIQLDRQASKVYVGYKYRGVIELLNIDSGGISGSAQAKPRDISELAVRVRDTNRLKVGTTPYNLKDILFRETDDSIGRAVPLQSTNKIVTVEDSWGRESKNVLIVQDEALPATVLSVDIFMETTDE